MSGLLRPIQLSVSSGVVLLLSLRLLGQAPAAGMFAGGSFSATAAELQAASLAVPADPQFGAQILLEEGTYRVAENGTLTYRHRMIFRVDAKEAIDDWSEASMQWDPWYEEPAKLQARVLRPDGRFIELDQRTITDAPVKATDAETYSSEHVRRAPIPGISVGAIVEEVDSVEEKTPYFASGSLYRFNFQAAVPMADVRLIVDVPAGTPFHELVHGLPKLAVERSEADGRRRTVYEQTGEPARHEGDIDLATNEPNQPMVEFATGASWQAVATGYAALSDPQTVIAEAKAILPEELPAGRTERIGAIVARLHREVRYTGVEFGSAKLTPQRPAEVIERHYGDCKDKANLLVAMLRAADIPATLALLNVGPGRDVDASLPGITQFDHAIVYVPAAGKDAAVWIDATAQYNVPGELPFMDAGRRALLIAPGTTGLLTIPPPKPEDSRLVETRSFTLSQLGGAQVREVSETGGQLDAYYRDAYGGSDTKKIRVDLEAYMQRAYLAKGLTKVGHGPPDDLTKPFALTLEADEAKRGNTALDEAVVVIFPSMLVSRLPGWFAKAPPAVGPDTTADVKHELELEAASRQATYVFAPFLDERRIRIAIPDGFTLRALPPDKTTKIGSGTLVESYSAAEKGVVTATFRFNSGPGTLTADEALAMRDAVLELNKRDYVGVYFDQVGAKEIAEGHIRAALAADRAVIAGQPAAALPHVRLARALLAAGIGDEARQEARKATELDPKSSAAFNALAWTLEHDSLGVRFGKGFDLAGSLAAYTQAIALDPQDNDPRFDQAILYEFDSQGLRYAADADMGAAARGYRELIERTKDTNPGAAAQYRENLVYVLLFDHKYAELDAMLAKLPFSNAHAAVQIASATAQRGTAAGLAQASAGNVAAGDRSKNLNAAGGLLAQLRLYPEASAILEAGIGGGTDAPTTARQIEFYKNLKPMSLKPVPLTDPVAPVKDSLFGVLAGTLTMQEAMALTSHHAYSSEASMRMDLERGMSQMGTMRQTAERSGLNETVLLDLITGSMKFSATGDDATGYAVVAESLGSQPEHIFVVKEEGVYRMVGGDRDVVQVGNAVLYALEHGSPKLAKSMLDWRRDLMHKAGGDDPFSGPLLPWFWTVGSTKEGADSVASMRLAGISLLAGSMDAKPYLAELVELQSKATGQRQTALDLLLASAAAGAEQPAIALPAAKRLLEQEPDSLTALVLAGRSYAEQDDTKDWLAMLAPLLAKKPKDDDLLRQQMYAYEAAHDYAAARRAEQAVLDTGKATSSDYNNYAWLGLFDGHVGEPEVKQAQQSNMLSKNGSFADLHTLACIYAALGRTTEARQVLAQAMQAGNVGEPNSAVWYALGLIYEQYGANEAALSAYGKVQAHEFDDHTYIDPGATYLLAQTRIAALSKMAGAKTAVAAK
jgi:transglutaminase-like putative cysteine protease/tetratricopeptide (TPR) repeat protein